jgi:hypothetical protein
MISNYSCISLETKEKKNEFCPQKYLKGQHKV